jgi:hypothetical protein
MKVKFRKFQIAIALGIFWFVASPAFFYFSALNELNVKLHPRFENIHLGNSDFNLETPKKTFGSTFIIHRFLRNVYILHGEISSLFPQVSPPDSNFLILRC